VRKEAGCVNPCASRNALLDNKSKRIADAAAAGKKRTEGGREC
jgi:hypothetical protein